jgi:hypothetical protein
MGSTHSNEASSSPQQKEKEQPPSTTQQQQQQQQQPPVRTPDDNSVGGEKNIDEYLESIYYDPLHPGSYSGVQKFWTVIKADNHYKLRYKQVSDWLKKQETYVRHQAPPKIYP